MDRSGTRLVDLPFEIISQIFTYLVPKQQTFRIKTLQENISKAQPDHTRGLKPVEVFYSWTDKQWILWRSDAPRGCPDVLQLLLIHPIVYSTIVPQVYANNMLWFPDLFTLRKYTDRFSLRARNAVTKLAVDACGRAYGHSDCRTSTYAWECDAEMEIADVLTWFPALADLRLGGIGPGLEDRVEWSDDWTAWPGTPGPKGTVLNNSLPPGPVAVLKGDANEVWPFDCIALVAAIVGVFDSPEKDEKPNAVGSPERERSQEAHQVGPLQDGKVFCHKFIGYVSHHRTGFRRRMGTRIIRRGEPITLEPKTEMNLINIAATLAQARIEAQRKAEYERRVLAGEYVEYGEETT